MSFLLSFQAGDLIGELTLGQIGVWPFGLVERFGKDDLSHLGDRLGERAARVGGVDVGPVTVKTLFRHHSAEQDAVGRGRKIDVPAPERDVPGPVLTPVPYHPVGLSIDVKRESVERDLHFQLHFPHGVIS